MTKEMTKEQAKTFLLQLNTEKIFNKSEHEAIRVAIKSLEQQPSDDVMAIHTQGLDEGIRCAMCTNTMKSDSGCDGGCVVNEDMYKKVMDTIKNQMFSRPTSDDCVSRADARCLIAETFRKNLLGISFNKMFKTLYKGIDELPPVTPTHGTCKDCKYSSVHTISLDKIGEIRVCRIQFSKQIKDDYYCADYEKRSSEDD